MIPSPLPAHKNLLSRLTSNLLGVSLSEPGTLSSLNTFMCFSSKDHDQTHSSSFWIPDVHSPINGFGDDSLFVNKSNAIWEFYQLEKERMLMSEYQLQY